MAKHANVVVLPSSPAPVWRVDRRGSFTIRDSADRIVTPRGRKARAILAFLAVRPDEQVSRERLIELLWPDRGEAQARGSLRQSLLEIRHAAPQLISSDHDHVWIDSARIVPSEFPDQCSPQEQLLDDLEGITAEYDEWLRCERAAEASEEWSDLERKAENLLAGGNGSDAFPFIERMQRIDPYNEDWLRLAMRAECQAGHPAQIQTRFRELDELLKRELGVSLSAQTRALHDELLAELAAPIDRGDDRAEAPGAALLASAAPGRRRYPWLAAAGIAGLVTTLGLSHSAQTASPEPARIAVLPFHALDGVDPALAEGMADEVLGDLSQQNGLRTIGRTSSWIFKDKPEDLRRVGRKLDARYVVEGSVRQAGGGLRLNVALIDTRDASTLWSGRYASPSGDVQRVENAASGAILQHLGLTPAQDSRHADPRAYALYIRAKALIRERNWSRMPEARDLLRQALSIDPNFAPAWAQLGQAIIFVGGKEIGREADRASTRNEALTAVRRAITLDPDLAEGHQMLGLIFGYESQKGRASLSDALRLDPRDAQTLFWWGNAAALSANNPLAEKAYRRAMALEPLWVRPVEFAALYALNDGRRQEAYSHVERLRPVSPAAALEVEMLLAHEEGDLSRVIKLGRAQANILTVAATDAKMALALSLIELGYVREAALLADVPPLERQALLRKLPGRAAILAETREFVGIQEEPFYYWALVIELARTGRYSDLVALFDRPGSAIGRLRSIEEGNRDYRAKGAPFFALALAKSGRSREAAQLFRAADEGIRTMIANGKVPPKHLAELAMSQAVMGRKEAALRLLEQAVARGWFAYEGLTFRLNELPWFAGLSGDPRFERLVRITDARLARERRETEALGLI